MVTSLWASRIQRSLHFSQLKFIRMSFLVCSAACSTRLHGATPHKAVCYLHIPRRKNLKSHMLFLRFSTTVSYPHVRRPDDSTKQNRSLEYFLHLTCNIIVVLHTNFFYWYLLLICHNA